MWWVPSSLHIFVSTWISEKHETCLRIKNIMFRHKLQYTGYTQLSSAYVLHHRCISELIGQKLTTVTRIQVKKWYGKRGADSIRSTLKIGTMCNRKRTTDTMEFIFELLICPLLRDQRTYRYSLWFLVVLSEDVIDF